MKKRVFGILIVTLLLINLNFVIATCPSIGNDQVYVGGKNRRALQTIAELENIWSSREPGFKRDSLTLNKICDLTKDYYAQLLDGYCEACDRLEGVTGYLDKPYTKYVSSTGLEFSSCNDNDIYKWDGSNWILVECSGTDAIHSVVCEYEEPLCIPKTCANYSNKYGKFDDNCEGDTGQCNCSAGDIEIPDASSPNTYGPFGDCCTPESQATTCDTYVCGNKTNNCGQNISCGTCNPGEECVSNSCIILGDAKWKNMEDILISTADLNDTVKLVLNRTDLIGEEVEYTIKERNGLFGQDWLWPDSQVAQFQNKGIIKWRAGEDENGESQTSEGTYYFIAKVVSTGVEIESGDLVVSMNVDNTPPTVIIDLPQPETNFAMPLGVSQTNPIDFNQTSSDEDDDLNIFWDFGDDTIEEFSNCLTTGNCNTIHSYLTSGTKIIEIKAQEMPPRSQFARNRSRIYIYKEGMNIFSIITGPDYRKFFFTSGSYLIDGSTSFVANCSYGVCPTEGISGTCYTPDSDSALKCIRIAEGDTLDFKWIIDEVEETKHAGNSSFRKVFIESGNHEIELEVSYTF